MPADPRRRRTILSLCGVLLLLGMYVGLNWARVPRDPFPVYDEGTHIQTGMMLSDAFREGDYDSLVQVLLADRVLKGVVYRYYFAIAQYVAPQGTETCRYACLSKSRSRSRERA